MSNRDASIPILTVRCDGYRKFSLVWYVPASGAVSLACPERFKRARDATAHGLRAGFGCAIRVDIPTMKG